MKIHNRNMTQGLILIACLLSTLELHAQTLIGSGWTSTTPAITAGVDSPYGTFISTASFYGSPTFTGVETSTSNPQLLWVPALAALRAGLFSSAPSTTTLGQYSTAFGQNTTASGSNSFAVGNGAMASGTCSFAEGNYANAIGSYSFSLGLYSMASGTSAVSLGTNSASGANSLATGSSTQATGTNAASFNYASYASGNYATAFNFTTTAGSYASTAFGRYNLNQVEGAAGGTPSSTTWNNTPGAADPLFEIGNGTSTTPSNAMTVYKDGNMKVGGVITAQPGGDIPMYSGN